MIAQIKKILGIKTPRKSANDFSAFFHTSSPAEKRRVLQSVAREANNDQRDMLKRFTPDACK